MAKSTITMKLLVDTQSNRVLFAEAGKDCVDFLFHLLSLPLATVINLLKQEGMVGSVKNLYDSIENLKDEYVQPPHTKISLLKPKSTSCACSVPQLQLIQAAHSVANTVYRCGYCSHDDRYTYDRTAKCPKCSREMNSSMTYVGPAADGQSSSGGFVKAAVTYMVMDDLVVTPMSTISCLSLMSEFNIQDVAVLQERVVNLGMSEAVKLLKASLHSKTVLTDVFLTNIEVELD